MRMLLRPLLLALLLAIPVIAMAAALRSATGPTQILVQEPLAAAPVADAPAR